MIFFRILQAIFPAEKKCQSSSECQPSPLTTLANRATFDRHNFPNYRDIGVKKFQDVSEATGTWSEFFSDFSNKYLWLQKISKFGGREARKTLNGA